MKVIDLIPAAGSPGSLATTAFHGALLAGLSMIDVEARAIGLPLYPADWTPSVLGDVESRAPWLPPTPYRFGDRADAAERGIFERDNCAGDDRAPRWRLELLLERELLAFAQREERVVVFVDTRSYPVMRSALRCARRLGWKTVAFSNEALTDLQIDPKDRDDYIRCVTGCADGVWTVSEHLAAYWTEHGVPSERLFLQPSVVRASSFDEKPSPTGTSRTAYVGNLAHQEVRYLIEIASLVRAAIPEFKLSIFGDATAETRDGLKRMVADRDLSDVVFVEPPVVPAEVPSVLAQADVLLLPRSRGEFSDAGFPNKLGEYLASGRPVVVTRVGDIPLYLVDSESAFLVEPDDVDGFAAAVVRALRSPLLGAEVGLRGSEVARQTLRADAVARRLVAFTDSLPVQTVAEPIRTSRQWMRMLSALPDPALLRRDASLLARSLDPRRRTR
ncbi:MAG: glycosyltransferase [Coriobacteriia bacterium]|nr:glycosyltransferase [Coriobacteriia bacterium]